MAENLGDSVRRAQETVRDWPGWMKAVEPSIQPQDEGLIAHMAKHTPTIGQAIVAYDALVAEHDRIKAQRDALVLAAEAAVEVMSDFHHGRQRGTMHEINKRSIDAIDALRAAVQAAKGGAE